MFRTDRNLLRVLLQAFPLLVPLNFYMFGDWMAIGFQWAVVRFQQVVYNDEIAQVVFPLPKDIGYISSGIITGRSAMATGIWAVGAVLLVVALVLAVFLYYEYEFIVPYRRYLSLITVLAGLLFLASCMIQYGCLLVGAAAFCVPFGVIILFAIGYWTYRLDTANPPSPDEEPQER